MADGEVLVPLLGDEPLDPTGRGDVHVATLTVTLLGGAAPEDAARAASSGAAGLTVTHAGGRPDLTPGRLHEAVARHRGR